MGMAKKVPANPQVAEKKHNAYNTCKSIQFYFRSNIYGLHETPTSTALLYTDHCIDVCWGRRLKPICFAGLLAILLVSPCKFFERAGFPRGIAALISLILAIMVFIVLFYFISNSII